MNMITEAINGGRVLSSILIADLLSFGNLDFFSEFVVVDFKLLCICFCNKYVLIDNNIYK